MKLNHLRDFLAVAEHGSLRAAARELGVAQPAVTRSIQELERELGATLFERRPRGVVPTAMGMAFERRARSVHNELLLARNEIDQLQGQTTGNIRVAISMAPHMALLPYALRQFRVRYPTVYLDILDTLFPTVVGRLLDASVDFYIGPPPDRLPEGLVQEKLFDTTRMVLGRKEHPLAHAKSLRELADAEWISTSITAAAEHELEPVFSQYNLRPPKIIQQSHAALTLIVSLLNSDLLAMLPVQWTEFELTKDVLQAIHVAELLPARPIYLIQRVGLPLTPAAEHFCDLMRRAAIHVKAGRP
ncbi:MAG: LysR substrate-binding domain-containing protein [Pseudomonadota bacterium]